MKTLEELKRAISNARYEIQEWIYFDTFGQLKDKGEKTPKAWPTIRTLAAVDIAIEALHFQELGNANTEEAEKILYDLLDKIIYAFYAANKKLLKNDDFTLSTNYYNTDLACYIGDYENHLRYGGGL